MYFLCSFVEEYQEKRANKLFPAYVEVAHKDLGSNNPDMYNVIGSFGVYTDKELGEKSFYQFKDMYSMFFGIPREESDDYCLFEFEDGKVELYFIDYKEATIEEYSIIAVYTVF